MFTAICSLLPNRVCSARTRFSLPPPSSLGQLRRQFCHFKQRCHELAAQKHALEALQERQRIAKDGVASTPPQKPFKKVAELQL